VRYPPDRSQGKFQRLSQGVDNRRHASMACRETNPVPLAVHPVDSGISMRPSACLKNGGDERKNGERKERKLRTKRIRNSK
jgi:hypothetical protein